MKISIEFIVVVVLFFLILFICSHGGNSNFKPYDSSDSHFHGYPYVEGLTSAIQPAAVNPSTPSEAGLYTKPLLGFQGLYASPYVQEKMIDPISQLPSSTECLGSSNGLSNSMGGICLTPEIRKLFHTRGDNQSGAPFQIGN
jgi:hypothetical protein